jgi:uncharacterized alkaline shock family protein YloU
LILRNIIITLLLLTLAAIAVVGVMIEWPPVLNWTPERINELGRSVLRVMRPGMLLFWTWWIVLLGLALVMLMTIARPRKRMKIEVQMGGGRVVIMDAAIKRYVRNALSELNDVTIKKIDLREQRGQVKTEIYADVRTRENLPTLERRIISRVRSALAEDLGITNLGDVHVYIKNFEVTGRPIKPDPEPADQPEPAYADTPAARPAPLADTTDQPETVVGALKKELTPSSIAATSAAPAASGAPAKATPELVLDPALEPVIGGETVADAEHHIGDGPSVLPSSEPATISLAHPEPTSAGIGDVILEERAMPAKEERDIGVNAPGAEASLADHDDLDDPIRWGATGDTGPDQTRNDEDKNGGLRSS